MTDPIPTAGDPPAAPPTSVQPPGALATPAAPVAAPAPPASPPDTEPKWVNERIAQAKRSAEADLLKALGVDSVDAGKAAVAAARAKADSEKTAEQRATEEKARADSLDAQVAKITLRDTEVAARMMVGLSPEQIAAVKGSAGDNPSEQIRMIYLLTPTWAKDAPPATAAPPTAPTAPSTTAPPPGAPNGTAPPPGSARGTYEGIRERNPFEAAAFGRANPDVYTAK
jgi:hypothetical protein